MQEAGLDAVHTLDLPNKNGTKDSEISRLSLEEKRIVVTKDADFVQSFLLRGRPFKLLLVSTGNISNKYLFALFESKLEQIVESFEASDFVELTRDFLILHNPEELP